jgi:hypothetical protein
VQAEEALEPIVEGVQPIDVSVDAAPGTWSVMVAVGLWLPRVAVTVALGVVDAVNVPVIAEKVLLVLPLCMSMLAGTASAGLLLARETAVTMSAARFRVTVQVEKAFDPTVEGVQLTVIVEGIWSVTLAVGLWLPRDAVTVALGVVEDVKVPVVAETVALLCPDSTVTLEGTVRAGLLLCMDTTVLDVAAWFR